MSQEAFLNTLSLNAAAMLIVITIGIIWWALCIILFFKIWTMTNDVAKIKEMFEEQLDLEHPYADKDKPVEKSNSETSD